MPLPLGQHVSMFGSGIPTSVSGLCPFSVTLIESGSLQTTTNDFHKPFMDHVSVSSGSRTYRHHILTTSKMHAVRKHRRQMRRWVFPSAPQMSSRAAALFITHDLRLVERFCQRVMVMDNGQIVETQVVGDKLTFPLTPDVCYKTRYYPHSPCAVAPQKRFNANATSHHHA